MFNTSKKRTVEDDSNFPHNQTKKRKSVKFAIDKNVYAEVDQSYDHSNRNGNEDDEEMLEQSRKSRQKIRSTDYSDSEASDDDAGGVNQDVDMFAASDERSKSRNIKNKHLLCKLTTEEMEAMEDATMEYEDGEGGIQIEPFNMRTEMEEGDFDESGNYIRKKDENSIHDAWLQEFTRHDIEKAAEAKLRRDELLKSTSTSTSSSLSSTSPLLESLPPDADSLIKVLLGLILPRESVSKALSRLNTILKENRQKKWGSKPKKKGKDEQKDLVIDEHRGNEKSTESEPMKKAKKEIELITEIVDRLVGEGSHDIFSQTYESLLSRLRKSGMISVDWEPVHPFYNPTLLTSSDSNSTTNLGPSSSLLDDLFDHLGSSGPSAMSSPTTIQPTRQQPSKWSYKWASDTTDAGGISASKSEEIYGPFEESMMREWYRQGFFESGIFLRREDELVWRKSNGEEFA